MGRGGSHVSNKELSEWVKEVDCEQSATDSGASSLHNPPNTQSLHSGESLAGLPPTPPPPSDSGGPSEWPA